MKKYFSNDPNGDGLVFHSAATAARAAADDALENERDSAGDAGWSEEVTEICWGEVIECVVETERRPVDRDEYGDPERTDIDEYVDYGLEFTEAAPRDASVLEAVAVLNRALAADPIAVSALVNNRVTCNLALAEDETIQSGYAGNDRLGHEVGMLGVINGIFGIRPNSCGYIVAECDDDSGAVIRFYAVDDAGNEVRT